MTLGLRFVFGSEFDSQFWQDAVRQCPWEFVRSRTQLALYEPERQPTGHRLTAWEVWHAYGPDVIEEAVENGVAVLKEIEDATEVGLLGYWKELGISASAVVEVTGLSEGEVSIGEVNPRELPIQSLEAIAFALGLDERLLSFKADCGRPHGLSDRLKALWHVPGSTSERVAEAATAALAEAVSVMRVQNRLGKWLTTDAGIPRYETSHNYGHEPGSARQVGYQLAEKLRGTLGLGNERITSMRDLVEDRLGIPVVWTALPSGVSGATFACQDHEDNEFRGITINSVGENEDVWVRRVTLARNLGHALFDPADKINRVWIDDHLNYVPGEYGLEDLVQQRADAFALALLAPFEEVRRVAPQPVRAYGVSRVMDHFGMCESAARRRIESCWAGEIEYVPKGFSWLVPKDEDVAAETLVWGNAAPCIVNKSRQGKFAKVVLDSYEDSLISQDTAALYMGCTIGELSEITAAQDRTS